MKRFPLLVALVALLHVFIGFSLLASLSTPEQGIGTVALACSAVLVPLVLRARRIRLSWLNWLASLSMGIFSWLLVLTMVRDLALGALALLPFAMPSLYVLRDSSLGVFTATGALTLFGLVMARTTARIVDVEVSIADLPPALQGFTIVQLSDIHVGPTIRRNYLTAVVDRVNRLKPDLIAITGDLVDGSVADLSPHVAPLAALTARHGTMFCTGNHEYYSDAEPWIEELGRLGIRVLLNEHVVLRHEDTDLVVAGVPDYTAHRFIPAHICDPQGAVAGAPAGSPRILLAHQPRTAAAAAAAGFDLQLSGHTHGGQFWPWNLFVPLQQPFTYGLNRLDGLWVYTSRGTGYWGPPMRFGAPSEITRLKLVRLPG